MNGIEPNRFLIDYLSDSLPSPGIEIVEEIIEQSLHISVITQIEFLGWHNHTLQSKTTVEDIIQHASIMHLTHEVINDTIALKQQMRVKTPDAIIASTCRIYHMTLITGNEKHFEKIPGVTTFNPWNNSHLPENLFFRN